VQVLRGTTRSQHLATDHGAIRRYLVYLATPLADWTTRYSTLRQVTAADVTDAVTAVKGPRAHERAVALRSLFRALKHAKLVFADPTRGLPSPAASCCPPPWPPTGSPGSWMSAPAPPTAWSWHWPLSTQPTAPTCATSPSPTFCSPADNS
jgi:hypothetical protein